ncbi:MAG: hypothetical protein WKF37_20960, partial [Bryobacteraceae bacterium]
MTRLASWATAAVACAALWFYVDARTGASAPPARTASQFEILHMSPLTSTGTSRKATISPDGNYVAYVVGSPGHQSLRVRQVNGGSDFEIQPAADVAYAGLTFSPDGNHIYYPLIEKRDKASTLYRAPLHGGSPVAITTRLESPVAFSPDGRQFAFVRESTHEGKSSLILADADGQNQRVLGSTVLPEYFDYPAWSPDRKHIACSVVGVRDSTRLVIVDVANGSIQSIGDSWRRISAIAWRDQQNLIVSGRGAGEWLLHLWRLDYPGGTRHRLTSDLNDYWGTSLTTRGDKLVTVQEKSFSGIWMVPVDLQDQPRHLVEATSRYSRFMVLPDGRIAYEEQTGSARRLMVADGKVSKMFTNSGRSAAGTVCPDKRTILYTSDSGGFPRLSRMQVDGSNATPIGPAVLQPDIACSADSQWVIYAAPGAAKWSTLWKLRIGDDKPVQLTTKPSESPALSPDGRT